MCTLRTQNICLMCHTQWLDLTNNQIGDAGLTAFAKAVESGELPQLEKLWLGGNSIGDVGLSALADVVSRGALASLEILWIDRNQIGDAGLTALASACVSGALPKCTTVFMGGNPASAEAQQRVKDAIASRQ